MKMSIREAINQTLHQEMERDERVIVLGEDVASDQGGVYGITDGLPARFGLHRVIDTPITESAIVGAAGGAALTGLRPVAELMFVDFLGVCLDQILNQIAKFRYMFGGQARTPDDLEDRQMTTAVVQLPGGGCLGVCSTHLDHKSELLRERQIGRVVAHCAAAFNDKLPHVVCGDLNSFDRNDMTAEQWESITALYAKRGWGDAPPDSKVQRVLRDAGYTDAFAIAPSSSVGGETPPRTCWTNTRLDYVMCQGDVGVLRFETIESDASDHLPVVVELEVPD